MTSKRSLSTVRLLAVAGGMVLFLAFPARADMMGGPPPCVAGSSPALLDTDGTPGPSGGDLQVYFQITSTTPLAALVKNPTENLPCNTINSNQVFFQDSGTGNPWPGTNNHLSFNYGQWTFLTDVGSPGNDFAIGGTFSQYTSSGPHSYSLLLLQDGTTGNYDRVSVSGGMTGEGDILGWDQNGDGTDEHVGLSLSGLGPGWNPCDVGGGVVISDATMLWVPVVPIGKGTTAVTVAVDMNCDGVADSGFPPPPPLIARTVPVQLQSFTVTSVLPTNLRSLGLAVLASALLLGLLRLLRGRLPGLGL